MWLIGAGSGWTISGVRILVAISALSVLAACGTLPPQVDRPLSPALPPSTESPLARIAQGSSPSPALTGFRLLPDGFYSLDARIQLARRARYSLDLQYYLIQNDRTGRLLMRELRDAALRGVRVRLLVDDLYTAGSDTMFRGLAAFRNAEVRLFNPFCCARQSVIGKYAASLLDIRRLNHRMHNKLFIADGAAAIMGGRNIADEYFARGSTNNFVDMDVFVVGPVVHELSSIFDDYWNSPQAFAIEAIVSDSANPGDAMRTFDHLVDDGEQMRSIAIAPTDILGYRPLADDLDSGHLGLVWGTASAFADRPAKVMATSVEMAQTMSAQMNVMDRVMESRTDVTISSPYLIPGTAGMEAFKALRARNVGVTILDEFTGRKRRAPGAYGVRSLPGGVATNGVDLYELSPTRIRRDEQLRFPGTSLGRLHAKTAVIDKSMVYIGSVNLDPRSENTNTELGLFARCPGLAHELTNVINISKLEGFYRLRFAPDGQSLQWLAIDDQQEVVLSEEPEATPLMRLQIMLLAPFVPEQLL